MSESDVLYDVGGSSRARPFMVRRLGHIGLYSPDRQEADEFFAGLLGFIETDSLPVGSLYTHSTDHHTLAIIDAEVGKKRGFVDRGITLNQLSFQVSTLEEVVKAENFLSRLGTTINRSGRDIPGSNWALYVHDPDDHVIELFYGMEQIGWDGLSKPNGFARGTDGSIPPLPVLAELDEIREASADNLDSWPGPKYDRADDPRFDAGGVLLPRPFKVTGIGPVYLFVRDMDKSRKWYVDSFGLTLTEEVEFRGSPVMYLRSGTAHHEIALLPIELRDELPYPTDSTLLCVGIKVANYRQLRDARDYLAERGCVPAGLPPELFAGMGPGFDMIGPNGQIIRMFHEMDQIGSTSSSSWVPPANDANPWPMCVQASGIVDGASDFLGPLG